MLEVLDNPPPERKHLHIIVPPLPSVGLSITLNCLVLGGDLSHVFQIDIPRGTIVADLKSAIKTKKKQEFDGVDAHYLRLWKVDTIDLEEDNLKLPVDLPHDARELMRPYAKLCEVFRVINNNPPEGIHLHIFVQRPYNGSHCSQFQLSPSAPLYRTQQLRSEYSQNFLKDPNLAVRPPSASDTIPSTLLHPIFGAFIDDCDNHEPTEDDYKLVTALSVAMTGSFRNETEQASAFYEVLQEHDISLRSTTIEYASDSTSGDMQYKGFRYAIAQVGAGVGLPKAEPHMQALSTYIHSTGSFAKDWPAFRFPCILITVVNFWRGSSFVDFSGAVWSTRPNMESIATMSPLCYDIYRDQNFQQMPLFLRRVGALRKALRSLLESYKSMSSNTTSPSSPNSHLKFLDSKFPDPSFPYPYSYTCTKTSSTCYFTYCHQMDSTRLLFSAKTADGKTLCIKFTRSYSKEVHQRCASGGFAPALHGFEHLPGRWYMIVMEMITDDYCCLGELSSPYPHHDAIATALQSLHQERYVHGDMQKSNIMVKRDCSPGFKLLDFDWSGIMGEVRYRVHVPRGDGLWRPDGAEYGKLILAEHDTQTLHAMFPEGTFIRD